MLKKRIKGLLVWAHDHPVTIAAIAILFYYAATSLDLLRRSAQTRFSFLDFFLHFDSLIWMWLLAFVFTRLQDTKKRYYSEEREKLLMQLQVEKSKIASSLLREITRQLQDAINNPLAVIRVTTDDIRKRFLKDPEVMRRLDQVDASLMRIHLAIKDVASYQTARVLETLQSDMKTNNSELYQEAEKG